ncbi:MAG: aldehyde dehydrogenase family protein [Gammaproteobacteria bacterium]|nr:aldehyde dehydrogenase family protein [Gammaproteobacteria bacterium]
MNTITPSLRIAVPPEGSRQQIEVVDPFDRQPFATLDVAVSADIDSALTAAAEVFADRRRWLSGEQRRRILADTAAKLEQQLDSFTEDLAREGGKPRADARIEVVRAVDGLRNCAELLRSHGAGESIATGINAASAQRVSFATHEPIGVVAAVSAFNHPLNLAVHQIGPAVAAGCPFILKPSTSTPYTPCRLVDLMHECGLPPAHGQALIINDNALSSALATDARVAFFSFIGSAAVGWMLRSKLAPGTRCALEHGGAAPVIVNKDIDIKKTAALLARGGFYHAGQVCISAQRVFAHRDIAEPLAIAVAEAARAMPVGAQLAEGTMVGPMITPAEVTRVQQWVDEARSGGGEILTGGQAVSETCFPATVIAGTPTQCRLARQEVFGPVVTINAFDDLDVALGEANSLDYKFQASVFSADLDFALYCYRRLDASAVMINDHTAWRVDWMPFAGLAQSGYGIGGIPYTFDDMQISKLAVIHSPSL